MGVFAAMRLTLLSALPGLLMGSPADWSSTSPVAAPRLQL
jgi:hypothetical protein